MKVLRKIGVITISKELYEQDYKNLVLEFFKDFQPLQINLVQFPAPLYKCTGLHNSFDPIQEGDNIPEYDITCVYSETIKPSFTVKRKSI